MEVKELPILMMLRDNYVSFQKEKKDLVAYPYIDKKRGNINFYIAILRFLFKHLDKYIFSNIFEGHKSGLSQFHYN